MFVKKKKANNKPPQKNEKTPKHKTRPALSHPKNPAWIANLIFTVCSKESERSLFSLVSCSPSPPYLLYCYNYNMNINEY